MATSAAFSNIYGASRAVHLISDFHGTFMSRSNALSIEQSRTNMPENIIQLMTLSDGYGVLIGQIERHFIDPPDNEGH